jgi:hypothetical protein
MSRPARSNAASLRGRGTELGFTGVKSSSSEIRGAKRQG